MQTVGLVLLVGVVGFFALTRTEVGRDELRQQLESQFSRQFEGELRIDRLRGTLVNDLFASGVQIVDPEGRTVIEVDSVVARPQWTALLGRMLQFRSVTLIRPHVLLHRDADSTWSIRNAFARTSPTEASSPLDLAFANVEVVDGRLTTRRDTPPPQLARDGWLVDYADTDVVDLNLEGGFSWSPSDRSIRVESFTASIPEHDFSISDVSGKAVYAAQEWTLTDAVLDAEGTSVRAGGTVKMNPAGDEQFSFTLDLPQARFDFDALRRLSPRLPLADAVALTADVSGTPGGIVIRSLQASRGASRIDLDGTVFDLPTSLDVDLRLANSVLTRRDVQAVVPSRDLASWTDARRARVDLSVLGTVEWRDLPRPTYDLRSELSLATDVGAVRGSLVVRRDRNLAPRYDGGLQTDSLNVGRLYRPAGIQTRLNGRVDVKGQGVRPDSLRSTVRADLGPSVVDDRAFDSTSVSVDVTGRLATGSVRVVQTGGGALDVRGQVDARGTTPAYTFILQSRDVNARLLAPALPETRYNATLTGNARGITVDSLAGTFALDVDSSSVTRGDSTTVLPPHRTSLRLSSPQDDAPRLRLAGTVASLTLDGDVPATPLVALGRLWGTALRNVVREAVDKPYPSASALASETESAPSPDGAADSSASDASASDLDALRAAARQALQQKGAPSTLSTSASLELRAPDVARMYLPGLPELRENAVLETQITSSPDTLSIRGSLNARGVRLPGQTLRDVRARFRTSGSLRAPLIETLSTRLDVDADTVRIVGSPLHSPALSFDYANRQGLLTMKAYGTQAVDTLRLSAGLRVLSDRNEVRVQEVFVGTERTNWSNDRPGVIELYRDAAVVSPLALESPRPGSSQMQRIRLGGRLTGLDSDTVFVQTDGISLYPLTNMAGVNRPLGGLVDGRVVLTGGLRAPVVDSDLTVHRFSFDRRLLGRVDVSARYERGSPDVALRVALAPEPLSLDSTAVTEATLVPGGLRRSEPSRLQLDGTIRVPALATDDPPVPLPDAPEMDLSLNVERADLFFFEYIFESEIENVRGYTAGTATITGPFTKPIFNADMVVDEGRFALPRFGLAYRIGGDVRVDRAGIHMQDVLVEDDDGNARLNGSLLFNDYRFFSFDLQGDLNEISVIDVNESEDLPFYGTIRASGPASLVGPLPDATLRSPGVRTTPNSELFIPISEDAVDAESGFIIFADSTGALPNIRDLTQRDNILAERPAGEPSFIDGLDIDINIEAPSGSTVNLVFDPLVGDVLTTVGSGRVQFLRQEGEFLVFGRFDVTGGNYLFTAGEVFVRRFNIEDGTLTWDGDPVNARMDIDATYRTRASTAGLDRADAGETRIPVVVNLDVTGRVETPRVDLSLSLARDQRNQLVGTQTLDAVFNQPELATEYATSVLLTNTFLLTTSTIQQSAGGDGDGLADAGNQLAFNSVSQLVASQLNRYLSAALPNVDVNLGLQGNTADDLDVIYGVALRLLNERLIIRGEGIYQGEDPESQQVEGPQGEVVIEVRLSDRVSAEVFFRQEGDDIAQQALTRSAGAGLSYQTEFTTWRRLFNRLFGWLTPGDAPPDTTAPPDSLIAPAGPADSLVAPSEPSGDTLTSPSGRARPSRDDASRDDSTSTTSPAEGDARPTGLSSPPYKKGGAEDPFPSPQTPPSFNAGILPTGLAQPSKRTIQNPQSKIQN